MLTDADLVYEISFGVGDSSRFEEWFPDAAVEWATIPGVQTFRVYRGVDGERKRHRLVFGFEDYDSWRSFVQTATHRDSIEVLDSIGIDVRTTLWSPSVVTLVGDQPAIVDLEAENPHDATADGDPSTASLDDAVPEI